MRCALCGHGVDPSGAICLADMVRGAVCACRCLYVERSIANWPHLLARVLYVPGMCAAISQRENRWREPPATAFPSWAVKP